MTDKYKKLISLARSLERQAAYSREMAAWPWPELAATRRANKKFMMQKFIGGFSDLAGLKSKGVLIRAAAIGDYGRLASALGHSLKSFDKMELRQLLHSPIDVIVEIPERSDLDIDFTNLLAEHWGSVYFLIGAGSRVSIIERRQPAAEFAAGAVVLLSGQDCDVEYLALASSTPHSSSLRSHPGRKSHHRIFAVGKFAEKYYHYNIASYLTESESESRIAVSLNFAGAAKSAVRLQTSHVAADTVGDIKFKGIGWDGSQSKVDGLIGIGKKAARTSSYLKEDIILASEESLIKAEPNLEILNNDVKASHGATIGHMDQNALFYLMSRGLPRRQAEMLIAEGFLKSLAGAAKADQIRQAFMKYWN